MDPKEMMEKISQFWEDNKIFEKSVDLKSSEREKVFFDGPPFKSGDPHYGHGLTSTMKDVMGRFWTMKGYKVPRNWGRDCHGLPVEKYVESKLGINGKREIEEKIGIEKFVEECRRVVYEENESWEFFIRNIGRRVDMDNAYYTADLDFMESTIWVFKKLYDRGLVYKSFKVQGYCPSCGTTLSNAEITDGYKDKQDPAVTVKFLMKNKSEFKKLIVKKDNKILLLQNMENGLFCLPDGESGEKIGESVLIKDGVSKVEFFEEKVDNIVDKIDKQKYKILEIEVLDGEQISIKIGNTIIDDSQELSQNFADLYAYLLLKNNKITQGNIYSLVWTTTPWTLPSNMFLAVGENILYALIYDFSSKEYYIVAKDLISRYYKSQNDYIIVQTFYGNLLENSFYQPLFDYILQSDISEKYKNQFFQVLLADFVSTDAGTGIVHLAPAFGEDDWNAVTKLLKKEEALQWLFLPVDEYGEFTELVPDYKGKVVFEANKEIIQRLKKEGKLVHQSTINHSYPHCRRCKTPLLYKAVFSWFIKEHDIAKNSVENAQKINWVPKYVKKRFTDVLESAPDWNVSRNRYWGAPIPIWENEDGEKLVVGNLNDLYKLTRSGSKNITKFMFIRHGETNVNPDRLMDVYGDSYLSEKGLGQVDKLTDYLTKHLDGESFGEDYVVFLSPLQRTFQTAKPLLQKIFSKADFEVIEKNYYQVVEKYQKLFEENKIFDYLNSNEQKVFEIGNNVYVDFRLVDFLLKGFQGKRVDGKFMMSFARDEKMCEECESLQDNYKRIESFVYETSEKFKTKTIFTFSHCEPIIMAAKFFKNIDYHKQRYLYKPDNTDVQIYFFDNDRQKEVDLHRPYVDNYWFIVDGKKYKRIPEVLDCWFESGSMPYGQINYLGEDDYRHLISRKYYKWSKFPYPADFIIEGLDQTRGWFRTLHILGNGIMNQNAYNNVVVNGLILAEDGKKMSKSLKNYPDPKYLFSTYGTDAYRLYLLMSPAVRGEPLRFSEKGVEQVYKDFVISLKNTLNFFKMYAKVDKFKFDKPDVYFVRHAEAESVDLNAELTLKGKESLSSEQFIENLIKINPDVIISSHVKRAFETAEAAKNIISKYLSKDVDIQVDTNFGLGDSSKKQAVESYLKILEKYKGKKVLIVGHNWTLGHLWSEMYNVEYKQRGDNLEFVKLPTWKIVNELDKWILAELNVLGEKVDSYLQNYYLDLAGKEVFAFIDKLNNWFIRRSRRRFWKSGRDEDKKSAYNSLFVVVHEFLKICAPFTPFISEFIYQELKNYSDLLLESVHLESFPVYSRFYVDLDLLEEIKMLRKIISMGLYIRSKNNIKVKQPLKKMILGEV